ncbi:acyl carrier protein [Corynebacterium sp. p3-SID1056]|uniref:acyl carrier protein n=1 Tax=Corynebacterium sp. p3-SID1056 TaxID=2916092 RepID=UPI0021A6E475|nr:acyl carrier protein [Corynebacterium sp. p3-SID1056]MCT2338018.1 acyl carrier protein [Corynebacterium sp. p3-SID1056]
MKLSQRLNLGDFSKLLDADEPEKDTPADAFSRLSALIERVTGEEDSVSPSTALTDTGLSSLDRIELAIRIEEEFGARMTERIYDEYETVGELADFLEDEQ